jgi:hypothetical protein
MEKRRGKKMRNKKMNSLFVMMCVFLFFSSILLSPLVIAKNQEKNIRNTGFSKGISWTSVVPLKKTTFVNFDENGILDDYAYLSALPTTVFYDKEANRLFSNPLLFYQDEYPVTEDKYRTLNAHPGIDYFMEDWMTYCSDEMDKMTLINVPRDKLDDSWKAKNYTIINGDDPYIIANQIALQDWSYAPNAVLAAIEKNFTTTEIKQNGNLTGVIPGGYYKKQLLFNVQKPEIGVAGKYESFEITEPAKYVVANMYWENVLEDLDLQLFDDQLGMTDADSKWNVLYGPGEVVSSYVYDYGRWEIGVTYMPTKGLLADKGVMQEKFNTEEKQTGLLSTLGLRKNKNLQKVTIDLYPGVDVKLNDTVPFGCRNVEFTLKWDNPDIALGFIILDTSGAETASAPSNDEIVEGIEKGATERVIKLEKLGETSGDKQYTICVFTMDDATAPIDFSIEYTWNQNYTRRQGDSLASATEGAILASILNAPLLYTSQNSLSQATEDVLYKLGVEHIYLVNLGNYLPTTVIKKISEIADITNNFIEYKEIYNTIRNITKSNDVVFSTIDPWTYYYTKDQVPAGQFPGALFIGPAAYIAAHHGTPVLLVDNHPELSQAVVWHTKFWQETANITIRPKLPTVACMVLTGRSVVKFLTNYGYDLNTNKENLPTMITVADHFDIGPTWDRTFTGVLIPGRFCSSPVDVAYWVARSVFYPALIFENPALNGPVTLVDGSRSIVIPYLGKLLNPKRTDLVYLEESKEKEFQYPILHTYNVYLYKFNEIGSKHWGGKYTTANGIIPYDTPSNNPIDDGSTDKSGAFYPDLDESEVTPFYAEKAGYSNCFSSNFDVAVDNLNKGVIMWMESCHGYNGNNGSLAFWNPESPYVHEPNPWRAYERPLLALGNLHEATQQLPETLAKYGMPSLRIFFKISQFLTRFLNRVTIDWGCTEHPDMAVMNPQLPVFFFDAFIGDLQIKQSKKILGLLPLSVIPILGRKYRSYGSDGVVIDPTPAGENVIKAKNSLAFDEKLGNLHSCGLNAVSCLVAHTYFQQVMIRHGTAYQILDPWSTSWYSGIWLHSIPRQLALGYTIGQAYENGMAEVGVQYLVNQWWWDLNENVVFYGDPDIRVWTPSNEWDIAGKNHWSREDIQPLSFEEGLSVDGHMLFGATSYPMAKTPLTIWQQYLWLIGIIVIIVICCILFASLWMRKKEKKKKE